MRINKRKETEGRILAYLSVTLGAIGVIGTILGMNRARVNVGSPQYGWGWDPGFFSKYYSADQITKSNIAINEGINNLPTDEALLNASFLAQFLLDPITDWLNINVPHNTGIGGGLAKLIINSWYRSPELNAHPDIKGSSTSDHLTGSAVDVKFIPGNNHIINAILQTGTQWDQLIIYPNYIHLSWNPSMSPWSQPMTILKKQGTTYVPITLEELKNYA